jgi:LytS/YehU family sensor histidine kinase
MERTGAVRQGTLASVMDDRATLSDPGGEPVSVHFVNNVLAAAASLIEVEPDSARDVLADLGAFLSHRLRPGRIVPLSEELEHVATYARLEQARFPGRLLTELPSERDLPAAQCTPGEVQAPVAAAVGRWLGEHRGSVRLALRARLDGASLEAQLDRPDDPSVPGERVRIALSRATMAGGVA